MIRTILAGLSLMLCGSPAVIAGEPQWALVNISVAHLRDEPRHGAEMVSQAILGTPLRLVGHTDGWWQVESPDGYSAYIIDNSVVTLDSAAMAQWRQSPRVAVTSMGEIEATDAHGVRLWEAVNASVMAGTIEPGADSCMVVMPDGRTGYVDAAEVMPLDRWGALPVDVGLILRMARSMMGTPYLWGGMSSKSMDCSGFVRVCYMAAGLILPRDASQQATVGREVGVDELEPGDLLFFGNPDSRRINHVAIYEGHGRFLHSSGRVRRDQWTLTVPHKHFFIKAVRVLGQHSDPGIVRVIDHPWYFMR